MDSSAFRDLGKALDTLWRWAVFGMICAVILVFGIIGILLIWGYSLWMIS